MSRVSGDEGKEEERGKRERVGSGRMVKRVTQKERERERERERESKSVSLVMLCWVRNVIKESSMEEVLSQ